MLPHTKLHGKFFNFSTFSNLECSLHAFSAACIEELQRRSLLVLSRIDISNPSKHEVKSFELYRYFIVKRELHCTKKKDAILEKALKVKHFNSYSLWLKRRLASLMI